MATNPYFNNYKSSAEQNLIDDLVIESVRIHGIDIFYIKKSFENEDNILNESTYAKYTKAFSTELYVKTFDGFQGQGDFLSKFTGMQIQDQMTVTIPIRTFNKNVGSRDSTMTRPREDDLIYFPLNKKFFKISFVEHESIFYQGGKLFVYDLKCELLPYSNEVFETGVAEIDAYTSEFRTDTIDNLEDLYDHNVTAKNKFFQIEQEELIDDSEFDPFKDLNIDTIKNSGI